MTIEIVADCAISFFRAVLAFASGPLGLIVLGLGVTYMIACFFEDLRR